MNKLTLLKELRLCGALQVRRLEQKLSPVTGIGLPGKQSKLMIAEAAIVAFLMLLVLPVVPVVMA